MKKISKMNSLTLFFIIKMYSMSLSKYKREKQRRKSKNKKKKS
jgi:hypothetical protein